MTLPFVLHTQLSVTFKSLVKVSQMQ